MRWWWICAEGKLRQADAALSKGLYDDAMRAYRAILKRETSDSWVSTQAHIGLRKARLALMRLQVEEARQHLEDGDRAQAVECCENAIRLAETPEDAREARRILEEIRAESARRAGLTELGGPPRPGRLASDEPGGEREQPARIAVEDLFEMYMESVPVDRALIYRRFGPVFRRAYVLEQAGRFEAALEQLDRVPAETASHPLCRVVKAQALAGCGRDGQARELLERLEVPEDLDLVRRELMAIVLWRQGEIAGALEVARSLCAADPENRDAAYLHVQILTAAGMRAKAIEVLEPWIDPEQVIPQVDRLAVGLLMGMGRIDEARGILARSVRRYVLDSLSLPPEKQVVPSFGIDRFSLRVPDEEPVEDHPCGPRASSSICI